MISKADDRLCDSHLAQVYFGFTHCPDICPEELDKMSAMLTHVSSSSSSQPLLPLFITCDPARDTPPVLKTYLREFDARIVGLTGTWDQIKAVCKAYRVYFSTPEGVKPGMDYLVDHSIYFYLMGGFCCLLLFLWRGVMNLFADGLGTFLCRSGRRFRRGDWKAA